MRIKIIGDNNCARATRHLLRMAGFAVTEFLPVEAITQAPHSGYAITIDCSSRPANMGRIHLSPAVHTPDTPTMPDQAAHDQTATDSEEALPMHGDASSPAFAKASAGSPAYDKARREKPDSGLSNFHATSASLPAEVLAKPGDCIHFDSVDSALETAILRHVTQLAKAPVIVDRPGGVVHSERELRIVVPVTSDAKMDEAAAVAVEFGVLRGLLDQVSPRVRSNVLGLAAEKSSVVPKGSEGATVSRNRDGKEKKWWTFGAVLIAHAALLFAGSVHAAPRRPAAGITHEIEARGVDGAYLHLNAALASAPDPQGQFAMGQGVKIFDGTNTLVIDPCKAQLKSYVSINQTANAQLVTGTASKKIYICSIHVVVAATANVALVEGTGTTCGTGTAGVSGFGGATAATGWNFSANGGIVLGNGDAAVGAEVNAADNLCLFNSGSGQVSGGISYVVE